MGATVCTFSFPVGNNDALLQTNASVRQVFRLSRMLWDRTTDLATYHNERL